MLVAAGAVSIHYNTTVIAPVSSPGGVDLALVRTALDWGAFFTLAVGTFRKRDRTIRVALTCLLAANVCVLSANWLFTARPGYRAGDAVDALWFIAWILKVAAARYAWHRYRLGRTAGGTTDVGEQRARALPHAIVGAAFVLLVYQVLTDPSGAISVFVYAAASMGALLVLREIAELRENRALFEAQLAQEARFRSLVQNSSDVVLVIGDDGRVSYRSPSVGRALGEGAIPIGSRLQDLVPADDLAGMSRILRGTPAAADRAECRLRTSAGDWREIEILATDMRQDAAVAGIVLNCRDVTDRHELERRLRHAQRLDAVGQLAGGLAHDFNNVLTAIRGYTELLLEDVPRPSLAEKDLLGIEQGVDRAAGVTKKLLAFSRRQAVQRTVLDLNSVLADLEPLIRHLVTDRIEVRTACSPSLWPVTADLGQMEQVIINLATNARDAMPQGGSLRISTANRIFTPPDGGLPASGDYVFLSVSDDGEGIPPDAMPRIFEPFFSTKRKDKGIGLGLAMVHGIVAQSSGHILVESREGRGTTFSILLPRSADVPVAVEEALPAPDPQRWSCRVLLVDDEPDVRAVVRRMLERAGCAVVEAAGGREALELIAHEPTSIDVLLTDLVMPGMHGRDLIAQFRSRYPHTPVICMTGFAGETSEVDGPELGATMVVTKPFSAEVLMRAVAAAGRAAANGRGKTAAADDWPRRA